VVSGEDNPLGTIMLAHIIDRSASTAFLKGNPTKYGRIQIRCNREDRAARSHWKSPYYYNSSLAYVSPFFVQRIFHPCQHHDRGPFFGNKRVKGPRLVAVPPARTGRPHSPPRCL